MYFYVDIAKRKRINQALREKMFCDYDIKDCKNILKGNKCLVFSNGIIGKGAKTYNYKAEDAIKMLEKLIKELK